MTLVSAITYRLNHFSCSSIAARRSAAPFGTAHDPLTLTQERSLTSSHATQPAVNIAPAALSLRPRAGVAHDFISGCVASAGPSSTFRFAGRAGARVFCGDRS